MKRETYFEYIERCRNFDTGFDVTNFTLDVNGKNIGVELPENYTELIDKISSSVDDKLEKGETNSDARGIATKITGAFDIEGLEELGEHFVKELSHKLYGGECLINHVHPYRNNIVDHDGVSSWIWHYDDVAPGIVKILVYLTDTTRNTGAFLALRNKSGEYPFVKSSKISQWESAKSKWPKSRIPEKKMEWFRNRNCEDHYVEGPKGTFILFNNNIIHRATIPTQKPERCCLIYQFRPYHKKMERHIGKDITWDWKSHVNSKTYSYDFIKTNQWKEIRGLTTK